MALALPWVTFSAMTDVAQASMGSLGVVERVAALHRVELFAGIPGRVLAAVAEGAVEKRLSIGEVLMEEGAVEAHLYAVVEGRVRVHRGDRTLVELGPGATVGELAVLVPAPARRRSPRWSRRSSCGSTRRCSTSFSSTGPSSPTA